jgi:HD-GYP domain-containing protein (c-di-GMP phosphodiesterase class II)
MKKLLIQSKAVLSRASFPVTAPFEIEISDDPISSFVHAQAAEKKIIVLVLSPSEYTAVRDIFSEDKNSDCFSVAIVLADESDDLPALSDPFLSGIYLSPLSVQQSVISAEKAFAEINTRLEYLTQHRNDISRLDDMRFDQEALIRIGRSLSTEKNQNTLLRMILMLSKEITGADAGSIYIVEETENGKQIRFKYSHTFSKDLPLEEFVLPYNTKSIAGYVAVTGMILNIPDVYELSKKDPVSFNNSFDKTNAYRSKSMLVIPMKNHIDSIIGVIQLINSKEDAKFPGTEAFGIKLETSEDFEKKIVPFDSRYEHLMEAVAGQAAIAIENNRMIVQIQHQFEAFVKASVTAIESRDPATSGHSFRVAEICTIVARAISDTKEPPFETISFTETQIKELEYAALLHDFGKVYIDLGIFKKAKKLFPSDYENLLLKLDYLYRFVELQGIVQENTIVVQSPPAEKDLRFREHNDELNSKLTRIKEIKAKVSLLNEPTITDEDPVSALAVICNDIEQLHCSTIDGKEMPIFNNLEKTNLSIRRGSLNNEERHEIESHVTHTYNFVSRIPWPPEFKNIPQIARGHHEKLDGSGYPNGDKGEQVSIQSRIMAIADVYDALTATDRPYKKALSHEKAIAILQKEADSGKIDADIFKVFIRSEIDKQLEKLKKE